MCYYITSVVPNSTNIKILQTVLQNHRLDIGKINNPYIQKRLSDRYFYFKPTTCICDCETALGKLNRPKKNIHPSTNAEIGKLQKRGWSKTKINRWIKEKIRINLKLIQKWNI